MDSILGIGLKGIQNGLQQAQESAERTTRAFSPESTEEPTQPLTDLTQAKHQVQASAKVVQVGDQLIGSILDLLG